MRIVIDCVRGSNGFPECGIDETDEQGFTALMYAAKGGNTAVVSKLLELGCDANILNNEGMSALQVRHVACIQMQISIQASQEPMIIYIFLLKRNCSSKSADVQCSCQGAIDAALNSASFAL